MQPPIRSHEQLEVYQIVYRHAMEISEESKTFPKEERYSLTGQIRKASRSVCSNVADAWRKQRYEAAFIAKLNDAEGEAAETQTWLDFSTSCGYIHLDRARALRARYDRVLGKLVTMIGKPRPWILKR